MKMQRSILTPIAAAGLFALLIGPAGATRTAAMPIFIAPVTPILGTTITGGQLLRICGVNFWSPKKKVTREGTNASDGGRHYGACWQYRRRAGRWKRVNVCHWGDR